MLTLLVDSSASVFFFKKKNDSSFECFDSRTLWLSQPIFFFIIIGHHLISLNGRQSPCMVKLVYRINKYCVLWKVGKDNNIISKADLVRPAQHAKDEEGHGRCRAQHVCRRAVRCAVRWRGHVVATARTRLLRCPDDASLRRRPF